MSTILISVALIIITALIVFAFSMATGLNRLIDAEVRAELKAQRNARKTIFR